MLPHAGFSPDRGRTTRADRRTRLLERQHRWVELALIVVLPFLATSVLAQSSPASGVLEFEQEGLGVKGYVLYATRREDGVVRRIDVGLPSKSATGRLQVSLPPLETGTWRLELAAYNETGESPRARAEPFEIRVDPDRPKQPKQLPAAKGESKRPPQAPKKAAPPKDPKKRGALGKVWRFIVGDDDP